MRVVYLTVLQGAANALAKADRAEAAKLAEWEGAAVALSQVPRVNHRSLSVYHSGEVR